MRYLTPHLKGKALSQYSALDEDSNYDEVKISIRRRFAVNAETYRQRLRAAKLKTGDDVTDLAIEVYTLTERWLQESEDKVETVALEQYYNAIPREIAEWLRDQQPTTLMETAGKVSQRKIITADTLEVTHLENRKEMKGAMKPIKSINYSERKITVMHGWKGFYR